MRIPGDAAERHLFYIDLIQKCMATCDNRRQFNQQMRSYYLFGCEDRILTQQTRFNKVYSHIDTLCSFMFSPESTRFTIDLGVTVPGEDQVMVAPLTELLQAEWHDCDIDQQFKQALRWSAPYGKTLLKFRPKVFKRINELKELEEGLKIQAFIVEPHNFGVLREDKDGLERQEAFAERFHMSKSELRNNLKAGGKKDAEIEEIMSMTQGGSGSDVMADAAPIDRLIVTAVQGDAITGNASIFTQPTATLYRPAVKEDMIEGHELYVYDDELADYRVVTYINPEINVWDRPIEKIFISQTIPYVEVSMSPAYDYFWGHSEVEKLVPLQDLRNERMGDILHLLRKQAHPPSYVTGTNGGIADEMVLALDTPSGMLSVDSPAAKVESVAPELPADLWHDIEVIDQMMDELSGLPAINQGKSAHGVRSEGHAQLMSQLGSTRIRDRALTVEDCLDGVAQLIVKILKKYDKRPMREDSDQGQPFQAHQFPDDFQAKVDGHSNSPVFVENHEQKAFTLAQMKVIDRSKLLDLIDIPMRSALKKDLREKIEPAEAKEQQQEHAEKMAQIAAKRAHGGHGPPVGNGAAPPGPVPPGALAPPETQQ
jgi:hypothetical protein